MRVLITGGLGFIGAWTARVLRERGHEVRVFDLHGERALFDAVVGGRAERGRAPHRRHRRPACPSTRRSTDCEAVVHLAAVLIPTARKDPLLGARINVLGTLHVFEAAKRAGVRGVAYASSAAVFGARRTGSIPEPRTHYGAYKLCNEGTARAYYDDAGIRSAGLSARDGLRPRPRDRA